MSLGAALLGCRDRDQRLTPAPPTTQARLSFPSATVVVTTPLGWTHRELRPPSGTGRTYAAEFTAPTVGVPRLTVALTCEGGCDDLRENLDRAMAIEREALQASRWEVEIAEQRRDPDELEYLLLARSGATTIVRGRHLRHRRGWSLALDCGFETAEGEPVPTTATVAALFGVCRQIVVREGASSR